MSAELAGRMSLALADYDVAHESFFEAEVVIANLLADDPTEPPQRAAASFRSKSDPEPV